MKHTEPNPSLFRLLLLTGLFLCPRSTVSGDGTSVPGPTVVATRQTDRPGEFRKSVKIAFYNVESFYDTIRSPMIDDGDYTPAGRAHWDSDRYRTKIERIARVLDDLNADLTGLCEIENESILRDLLLEMKTSCNYIYRAAPDHRGMDLALLYRGDTFFPDQTYRTGGPGISRDFLVVTGRLLEQQVILVVCHMPSMMNDTGYRNRAASTLRTLLKTLTTGYPARPIILMGDFNAAPDSRLVRQGIGIGDASRPAAHPPMLNQAYGRSTFRHPPRVTSGLPLYTPFFALSRKGFGTYVYRDRRQVFDFICLSPTLFEANGSGEQTDDPFTDQSRWGVAQWCFRGEYGIFVRDYLLRSGGPRQGYPLRTFESGQYLGGYSDHFPVWLRLELCR